MRFADDLQAVSVDEALIDVSARVARMKDPDGDDGSRDYAKEFAEAIRTEIRKLTSCESMSLLVLDRHEYTDSLV